MLTSINPASESGRNQRWATTATAYVVGSLLGGVFVFGLLGFLGSLVAIELPLVITALVFLVGALVDAFARPLPGPRRQVNENWLTTYRGWVYGLGFGFQLGMGVSTIVTTATVYTAMLATFVVGDVVIGIGIGLVFGFVRAIPLVRAGRMRSFSEVNGLMARMERWRPWSRRVPAAVQLIVAAALFFV